MTNFHSGVPSSSGAAGMASQAGLERRRAPRIAPLSADIYSAGADGSFKGFHFYDLPICLENHLDNIKIGVSVTESINLVSSAKLKTPF